MTQTIPAHKMRVMSVKLIPEHVDPFRYAEQSLGLDGIVHLQDMPRLSTMLYAGKQGDVMVNLTFGIDEQGINYLKGHLETTVSLQCQRCLEPLDCEIMSDFTLGIVNTLDEANALSAVYEPAIAKEGSLGLRELIEDEVLLNLPIIPRHDPDECKVHLPVADAGWEEHDTKNPFHVLASLKKHKKQ